MSLAMEGSFNMTYNGVTVNAPIYTPKHEIFPLVDNSWNFGCELESWGYCWEKHYKFSWTCEGGDKPLITVVPNNITSDGTNLNFGVWQNEDGNDEGYLFIKEMGPDFFRTPHDSKQVQVIVNEYPAWCSSSSDCSYAYDSSMSVDVTSMTQANSSSEVTLSISGSGFTNENDTIINVGHDFMHCQPTSVSSSQIDCTIPQPEAGVYPVYVFMKSKGEAVYPAGGLEVDVPLTLTSIDPLTGSLGGGSSLTVMGSGFSQSTEVTINDKNCVILSINSTEIVCITPPSSNETTFDVVINSNNKSDSFSGYTYNSSSTPTVTSLNPTMSSSPKGGEELTINGTAFGSSPGSIKICGNECQIKSWSDTQITCMLPENQDGDCSPVIEIPGNGYAGVENVPPISYRFRVTGMSPNVGSLLGGTIVKITGEGFTDDSCLNLTVNLGEKYTCEITECTNTYLICETKRIAKSMIVGNLGTHPTFGFGYRWSPLKPTIHPGDSIVWQWSLGSASADKGINVFQVPSLGMYIYLFHKSLKNI